MVGQIGLTCSEIDNVKVLEPGYILKKSYWHKGFALEGAKACVDYAFNKLNINEITAQIRPENLPSRKVAEKLGMTVKREFIKHYKGKDMLHLLYSLTRKEDF